MEPRIIGGYTLHALLGRGAMSEVYAASHPVHGDGLAFKLLSEPLAGDVAQTRGVDHSNVVRVIDTGPDFVVMERITGEDLATRLARLGRLDEATARTLFAAIADGMDAVHAHDLVHRDLKPANIMLAGDVPKIVDFGIAKYLGERSAVATDRRIGSPAYMAPEQLAGGLVAPCVDVWAFGVMLFEAVTGKLPFHGFADGRCPQLFETAPRVTTVTPQLARLIARCLEREPGRRPPTMAAIAAELRGADSLGDERVTQDVAPPTHVAFVPSRNDQARRRWPIALAVAALAATIVIVALAWPNGSSSAAANAAPANSASAMPASAPASNTASSPTTNVTRPANTAAPAANAGSVEPTATGSTTAASVAPTTNTGSTAAPASADPTASASAPANTTSSAANAASPSSAQPTPPPTVATTTLAVDVHSTPPGAAILIDGKPHGTTPAHLELAGPTSIVVRRAGYRTGHVRAEHAGTLDVQLAPLPHVTHQPSHGETLD